jgi:hypothetical protein
MAVFTKKDEKICEVVNSLDDNYTQEEFISKFIEMYPKDWGKIEKSYQDHERKTKPGKSHPMPKPEQFLKNALNVWQKFNK